MDTRNNDGNQYYLNIRYQENNSWQGSLQRLDTGETINFRSGLELLNLMESVRNRADESNHKNQKLRKWKNSEKENVKIHNIRIKNGITGL